MREEGKDGTKITEFTNKGEFGFGYILKWLLTCGWLALFISGIINYTGSWVVYTVFSIVFLAVVASGLFWQISYGYFFLVVLLWLGFWFKLTVHILIGPNFGFGEPIGLFVETSQSWDEVLWIATIAAVGVLLARLLYSLTKKPSSVLAQIGVFTAPAWYPHVRKWLWASLITFCLVIAIANIKFGILQIGIVSTTVLLWPLNAVISWLVGYGLTFAIATLLWWDMSIGRSLSAMTYVILLEAFTSSVSMLSRGGYIFHVVPQFFALYKNRKQAIRWKWQTIVPIGSAFILLLVISNPLVNSLRYYYYFSTSTLYEYYLSGLLSPWFEWGVVIVGGFVVALFYSLFRQQPAEPLSSPHKRFLSVSTQKNKWFKLMAICTAMVIVVVVHSSQKSVNLTSVAKSGIPASRAAEVKVARSPMMLLHFSVDRWLGAEGVMAVVAYPHKNYDLFIRGLLGRQEVGHASIYQDISQSQAYIWNMKKFQMGSIPGAAGFLYFSGKFWVVLVGMSVLTLLILSSEGLVFRVTSNPILSALWGSTAANLVVQMGVANRSLPFYFFELSCGIAVICLAQSKFFAKTVQKFLVLKK